MTRFTGEINGGSQFVEQEMVEYGVYIKKVFRHSPGNSGFPSLLGQIFRLLLKISVEGDN